MRRDTQALGGSPGAGTAPAPRRPPRPRDVQPGGRVRSRACRWARACMRTSAGSPIMLPSPAAPPPAKFAATRRRFRSAAQTQAGVLCTAAHGPREHCECAGRAGGRAHRPLRTGGTCVGWIRQRKRTSTARRRGAATAETRWSDTHAAGAPLGSTMQTRASAQRAAQVYSRRAGTTARGQQRLRGGARGVHASQGHM